MAKLPISMRHGNDPVSRVAALERRMSALEEWAEQQGWDLATGVIHSDLAKRKPGRPKKTDAEAVANEPSETDLLD